MVSVAIQVDVANAAITMPVNFPIRDPATCCDRVFYPLFACL